MRVGQRQPETVFFVSGCLCIFSQRTACQQAVGARASVSGCLTIAPAFRRRVGNSFAHHGLHAIFWWASHLSPPCLAFSGCLVMNAQRQPETTMERQRLVADAPWVTGLAKVSGCLTPRRVLKSRLFIQPINRPVIARHVPNHPHPQPNPI